MKLVLEKASAIPGLLLTTVIAFLLLAANRFGWSISGSIVVQVTKYRASLAVAVQIIAHLLGMLQVYALCSTLNLSYRSYFSRRSFSLNQLKFATSINLLRLDLSLQWSYLLALLAFIVVTFIPAAIWSGALTPLMVSKTAIYSIQLARFEDTFKAPDSGSFQDSRGRFSWSPVDLQGLLLNSAAEASDIKGEHLHPKLDKTGYSYRSRSYGLGSTVGLASFDMENQTTSYEFLESGFEANVSCIYNLTSAFSIKRAPEMPKSWTIGMYYANGTLPNDNKEHYYITLGYPGPFSVALISKYSRKLGYVAFATTASNMDSYGSLNRTQCRVEFIARDFLVSVNTTNRTISVRRSGEVSWPAYADELLNSMIYGFELLGLKLNGHFFFSVLGDTFTANIAKAQPVRGNSVDSNLTSIGDSVMSLIDNMLVSFSAAQFVLANKTTSADATTQYQVIVVGESNFIYSAVAFNLLVCSIYIVAAARTRMWCLAGTLNFLDAGNMAVVASAGGQSIYRTVQARHAARGSRWVADVDDALVGKTHVSFTYGESELAVALMAAEEDRPAESEEGPKAESEEHPIELRGVLVTDRPPL